MKRKPFRDRVKTKLRQQPRVAGVVREQRSQALLPAIEIAIEEVALRHGCTPAYVRATLLANALGIKQQPSYILAEVKRKRRA